MIQLQSSNRSASLVPERIGYLGSSVQDSKFELKLPALTWSKHLQSTSLTLLFST